MNETGCWYGESLRHFLADERSGNLVTEVINGVRKRKYSAEMTWFFICAKRTNSSVRGFFEKEVKNLWNLNTHCCCFKILFLDRVPSFLSPM